MKIGIVFGTFAPMHLGHVDIINIAKEENHKVIVICCGHEGDRGYPKYPLEERLKRAADYFSEDVKVDVTVLPDTDPRIKAHWDQQQIWNYWVERMLLHLFQKELILAKDELCFYTSEPDYADLLQNTPQNIKVHLCSRERNISGTMIRENPEAYSAQIVPTFVDLYRST